MSVYNNCYLFRSGDDVLIQHNKNIEDVKRFKGNDLSYTHDGKGNLIKVRDMKGNYYYLAVDCQEIQ